MRRKAGFSDTSWQGDTFKTVCAIHDFYPDFSYCTITMTHGRTLVWRSGDTGRTPVWASLAAIEKLGYADLLSHAALFMPAPPAMVPGLVGLALRPMHYNTGSQWERLCFGALQNGTCMSCGKLTAKLVKKVEKSRQLRIRLKSTKKKLRATKKRLRAAQKPFILLKYVKRLVFFKKI
ncbi:hypothetical protein LJC46_09305 [Desulfovibrio sp. OttesenSCG-928-G15]|nr:hypothetical protein [Desulfovibrio sp. OttesenSCG-928-G15]